MKIVPLTVSVLEVAFQESSPLVSALSQYTDAPAECAAAVVLCAPRETVQVVVPWPAVPVMSSSSIRIRKLPLVGKPLAEGTLSVVALEVIALDSVVFAPGPTRHVYDVAGVRSKG